MRKQIVSASVTFIANLLGTVVFIILALPDEKLFDPNTWTFSFVISVFLTAVRQLAIKPPVDFMVRK